MISFYARGHKRLLAPRSCQRRYCEPVRRVVLLRCTRSPLSGDNFSTSKPFSYNLLCSGDEMYDVEGKGDKFMPFHRAGYDTKTGQVTLFKSKLMSWSIIKSNNSESPRVTDDGSLWFQQLELLIHWPMYSVLVLLLVLILVLSFASGTSCCQW